jgi:hypothetical protein
MRKNTVMVVTQIAPKRLMHLKIHHHHLIIINLMAKTLKSRWRMMRLDLPRVSLTITKKMVIASTTTTKMRKGVAEPTGGNNGNVPPTPHKVVGAIIRTVGQRIRTGAHLSPYINPLIITTITINNTFITYTNNNNSKSLNLPLQPLRPALTIM